MQTGTLNILSQIAEKVSGLREDAAAAWGIMSPQHMVEHLIIVMKISNGKLRAEQKLSDEEVLKRREFLLSDAEFPQLVKNPILGDGLRPLKFGDLDTAKEKFRKEVEDFYTFHEQNPGSSSVHPLFGTLDREGWERFHSKHIRHHFKQFGLL